MTIHPSSHHDFVKTQEANPILEKVAVNAGKKYSTSWPLAGLFSALVVKLQTLFMNDKSQAEFISKKLQGDSIGPETLCWFSNNVIEQITTSDPNMLAKACACARDKTTKVALAVAFLNCWEPQSAETLFMEARGEPTKKVLELLNDLATSISHLGRIMFKNEDAKKEFFNEIVSKNNALPEKWRFPGEISGKSQYQLKEEMFTWFVKLAEAQNFEVPQVIYKE